MNLGLFSALGEKYKSNSQIARVVTEEWGTRNLYCPACNSNRIVQSPPNTRAIDFVCPECQQPYQLKSRRNWNENRVVDAGYAAMIAAIRSESIPNLFVRYDAASLHDQFGVRFRLVESSKELHPTPFGTTQQFLYCYCRVG